MRLNWKFDFSLLVPILATVLGVALLLLDPVVLQSLRHTAFDEYQRLHPRQYQPAPVHIIDIDDASLERLGQWPWPRTRLAELVKKLQDQGAATIVFDVIFAEPDRTSPKTMGDLWGLPPTERQLLAKLPDHDQAFAEAIARGGVVLGFSPTREGAKAELNAKPFRYITQGESPLPSLPSFSGLVPALPELVTAAAGYGALTFIPDHDGVVRRVPLVLRLGDEAVPSLVAEALRVAQGQRNYMLKSGAKEVGGLAELGIGMINIPTTPSGEAWVHYSRPVAGRSLPVWQVLADQIPTEAIEGSILLIGSSAQGLMDLRFSPLGGVMPGVEAHAQFLEQALTGYFLQRPASANAIEALIILVGGLLLGFLALKIEALLAAGIALLAIGGVVFGSWQAFTEYRLLFDPVIPSLALAIIFIASSLTRHFVSERRQRFIKQAFSRYVSPNLVNYLVSHPSQLELGGQRQECSFIFTDLAGFTTLMERIDPGDAVSLLNTYLDEMIAIAFHHDGTLDRIVGDAVAIMFSAPVPQPDHRQRAVTCALAMQVFASRFADELNAKGIPFGHTRIGVHTGEVIVGNFGGTTIFDYRALGDPVNTAARLESVNKHLGTRVCISEATLSGCPDTVVRPVGRLVLKGKTKSLMVYQPIQVADVDYGDAYALLASGDSVEALARFERLGETRPDDPLVKLHLARLRSGETGDLIVMGEK